MLKQALFVVAATRQSFNAWAGNSIVEMKTSQGTVEIELFNDKALISAKKLWRLRQSGLYSGTIFHRVIPGFMIQGGGMNAQMEEKLVKAPIRNELYNGSKNTRGTLAMARTNDPNSATSQFFHYDSW